jgi:hypothetical protein
MKKLIIISTLALLVQGCATKRSSQIYAGIAGAFVAGTIGAVIGKEASPNKPSETLNGVAGGAIGATLGGAIGALAGGYFHGEDPENMKLKNMIREQKPKVDVPLSMGDLGMSSLQIQTTATPVGEEQLPNTEVPDQLKKYVKKSKIIEHKVEEQAYQVDGNRTVIIPEFKIFEQTYEEQSNE